MQRYFELWGYPRKGVRSKEILSKTLEIQIICRLWKLIKKINHKTSQELRMLSSVTINCQVRMIVWIQVLNCQNCNQCLKCQVSSTVFPIVRVKNEGKKWNKIVINRGLLHMPFLLSKKQMLLHNECMEIFIDRDPDNEMGTQWGPKATKIGTKTELL